MSLDRVIRSGANHVIPELLTLSFSPTVGSLIDGDDELGRLSEKPQESCLGGFHDGRVLQYGG